MATVDGPDWYVAGELAFLGVNSLEDVQDNDEEAVIRTVCEAKRTRMGSVISHWRLAHHGITGMMSYILNLKRIQYQGRCRRRNCFKGLIRAIIVLHRMRLRAAQTGVRAWWSGVRCGRGELQIGGYFRSIDR